MEGQKEQALFKCGAFCGAFDQSLDMAINSNLRNSRNLQLYFTSLSFGGEQRKNAIFRHTHLHLNN